jgi:lysophospholipase L1-like esterase
MSTLLIFGDSWPHGSELTDTQKPYGDLLYKQIGCTDVITFAEPSTSIPHLILQLNRALSQGLNNCKAVFFLSGVDRDVVWEGDTIRCLSPAAPTDADWYVKYNSPKLSEYRVNVTLIALQLLCAKHNIEDYYIWGWDTVDLWPDINLEKIYPRTIADEFLEGADIPPLMAKIMYLKNSRNPYIWPNMGHPNQLGHQRIADILTEWICT